MLYVWLPAGVKSTYWAVAPWGSPVVAPLQPPREIATQRRAQLAARSGAADSVVGELSVQNNLLELDSTSFLSLTGLVLTTARNAGLRAVNTTGVVVSGCVLQNFGSMAVNASGGTGLTLDACVVRHAGNGAVFFYAGDRTTLTDAGHTVRCGSGGGGHAGCCCSLRVHSPRRSTGAEHERQLLQPLHVLLRAVRRSR